MSFKFGSYPQGDDINGSGYSLDTEFEQEERNDSTFDVADDVKAAMFEHGAATKPEAHDGWRDWVDQCQKDNVDPVAELHGFMQLDDHAHVDVRAVADAAGQLVLRPRYLQEDEPKDADPHIAAARKAFRSAGQYNRLSEVVPEVAELDRRTQGGFANYVRQVNHLKSQLRDGTPDQRTNAIATAAMRYMPYNESDPGAVMANYEVAQVRKLIPALDPQHPAFDSELSRKTAAVLSRMTAAPGANAYETIVAAMKQARRG